MGDNCNIINNNNKKAATELLVESKRYVRVHHRCPEKEKMMGFTLLGTRQEMI